MYARLHLSFNSNVCFKQALNMSKGILYWMFLSIQLLVNQVYCNQRICMQIENVNAEETYPIPPQRSSQGVPGKRGPPGEIGPKGSQGPRGPIGIVDYERMNAAIESAINDLRTETEEKMNKTMNDLQQRMDKTVNCEVLHKNKCYRMILRETQMNFDQATQACRDIGMNIGYIEDETHYQKIAELVRSKSTSSGTGYWTGLLYINSQLVTLSGNPSPFTKWYPGRPRSDEQYKNVYIYVMKDTGNVYQGMYNHIPTVTLPGVLCQIMNT
ncbi:uncharacterized protein LOC144424499 [Styela clava]